jgi:hypothetical protein
VQLQLKGSDIAICPLRSRYTALVGCWRSDTGAPVEGGTAGSYSMRRGRAAVILQGAEERRGISLVCGVIEETAVLAVYVVSLRLDSRYIRRSSIVVNTVIGGIAGHYTIFEVHSRRFMNTIIIIRESSTFTTVIFRYG